MNSQNSPNSPLMKEVDTKDILLNWKQEIEKDKPKCKNTSQQSCITKTKPRKENLEKYQYPLAQYNELYSAEMYLAMFW